MSINRPIAWLATIVVALGMATSANAQGSLPGPPGVITQPGSGRFWEFQPFLDPGTFSPDFQFFAPAEVNDFGGEEEPNSGLYVSFDRTYVNVSRPDDRFSFGSGAQGDFTWGNRLEVGYMIGDPKGWQAILWHVNGPNELIANAATNQTVTTTDGVSQIFQLPQSFDSLNQFKMSSFELNRVWRRPAFHNQTVFEPFIGYRYMNARDFFKRESFIESVIVPPFTNNDEFFFKFAHRSIFENNMHGGQLGARFFTQRGHWLLSADIRFFGMANFQYLRRINQFSILDSDLFDIPQSASQDVIVGGLADVVSGENNDHATQFCWGGEIRGEASYELTRDINLRFGFVFLDLGQGVGRGNSMRFNNQDVVMAGATFGFTVNR